jgi:hypothetical protein
MVHTDELMFWNGWVVVLLGQDPSTTIAGGLLMAYSVYVAYRRYKKENPK